MKNDTNNNKLKQLTRNWKVDNESILKLFFKQNLIGAFLVMLKEPIEWNSVTDKDAAIEYVFDHAHIIDANNAMLNQYKIKEEIIGKTLSQFFSDDLDRGKQLYKKLFDKGQIHIESLRQQEGLTKIWLEEDYSCIYDADGRIIGICGIQRDVTEKKKIENIIYNEKEHIKTTLMSVGDGVISTDESGNVNLMNPIAEKFTGWSQAEALGKPLEEIFNIINEYTREPCENPAKLVLQKGVIIQLANHTILISKDGSEIPIEDSAAPIKNSNGKTTGVVIVFRDFTEKREKQRQIEYLSFHDHLTGLYNRRYIEDTIKRLDTDRNLPFTVMIIDVNGLKLTNDAFGHEMGDKLLLAVADIMKKICRADDIIGRMGGDEFIILLPRVDDIQADKIKHRIIKEAAGTKLESIIVSLALGYAVKTDIDQDINIIITAADNNMYKDKIKYGKIMRSKTIEMVLRNINLKYDQEQIHTERVSQYSEAIARVMDLNEKETEEIKTAAILHDIGKIMVPSELLNKHKRLTKEEFEAVKKHPETGYQILRSVNEYVNLAEGVLYHHEHWDGTGYPEGLKGEEIPLQARIIAVADAYEAMTAKRPYQKQKSKQEAKEELIRCAGHQFDPEIVKVFIEKIL